MRSEYVRRLIEKGREYDDLAARLDAREDRIADLEDQLARRSDVEEKIDDLPDKLCDDGPDPPFPVRWYQWWRSRSE